MSHDEQFPWQPMSAQSVPVSSRDSCTAHFIPSFCIFLFVAISESMSCPLNICVSDKPRKKNPTQPIAISITISMSPIENIVIFD